MLLCPWDSPGKNAEVGSISFSTKMSRIQLKITSHTKNQKTTTQVQKDNPLRAILRGIRHVGLFDKNCKAVIIEMFQQSITILLTQMKNLNLGKKHKLFKKKTTTKKNKKNQ